MEVAKTGNLLMLHRTFTYVAKNNLKNSESYVNPIWKKFASSTKVNITGKASSVEVAY